MKRRPGRVHRDREAEGVGRGLLAVGEIGRRHHQEVVANRRTRSRPCARRVITMPASVSFTILAARSLSCFSTGLRAIDLRVDQRVRHRDVVLAAMQVIVPDVVGEVLVLARRTPAAAQAKPVSMMFMKSGLRPNMPQVASIQIFTISRRRTRSSIERGSMKESPTRSPLDGDAIGHAARAAPGRAACRRARPWCARRRRSGGPW